MTKNILKIVFLGLAGFSLLVYATANKPKNIISNEKIETNINISLLPAHLELVGSNNVTLRDDLFTKDKVSLILVGNHDSLSVIKEFKNYFNLDIPTVCVANISTAPWFVKKMFIPSKLEELNKTSNMPMIYDENGEFVNSLNLQDATKTKFFAYLVNVNGGISKIYEGEVKEGAMDGSMTPLEQKASLKPITSFLKNNE